MFNSVSKHGRHRGDPPLLRKVNESALLELIRDDGPITRLDLARRLHLSLSTVTRIVSELTRAGLVFESSQGNSSGGRRPAFLEFNFRSSLIISVYVGQRMVGSLSDLNGEVLDRCEIPSTPGDEGLRDLVELIECLKQDASELSLPVSGVCVGAPAIVKFPEGIIKWAPIFGWRDMPLRKRLEELLGLPVVVENEVNLIALGESWRGAGQGIANIICISLGAGIGAGLILGGQLYRGSHCAAGEVGYIIPNEKYLGQTYNNYGCLEGLAGSTGLLNRAKARLASGEASSLAEEGGGILPDLTAQKVLEAARSGDRLALSVVSETVDLLSIAIANLACIVDPERIIISGDLADYSDFFIQPIQDRIQGVLPDVMPQIMVSDLKVDAAVLGAVAIVMRYTSDAVFIQPFRA